MPLILVRNDITKMKVDAIVNAANNSLLGGGGVDGCIHRAAGPCLLKECRTLGGCETGQAKITKGYDLPCKYVIHTVGPIWRGGKNGEKELLVSTYQSSLCLALDNNCQTVAFPLISAGAYGYPKSQALQIAVDTIAGFLSDFEMTVYLVIFDKGSYRISKDLFDDIQSFIDESYVDERTDSPREEQRRKAAACSLFSLPKAAAKKPTDFSVVPQEDVADEAVGAAPQNVASYANLSAVPQTASLDDALKSMDESFSQMLLRKIDESGMTDSECYKKANIDRKLFSKIRKDINYRPSKPTVLAFAVALGLSLDEVREMLMKAGFALSRSNKFDIIVEYFISHGNYNIFEINEALFAFDQSLLGA